MHGRRRGRNRLAWAVWSMFFAGTVALLAWQLGWFPVGYDAAESGRLADSAEDSGDPGDAPELEIPPGGQSEPVTVTAQASPAEAAERDRSSPFLQIEPRRRPRGGDDSALPRGRLEPGAASAEIPRQASPAHFVRNPETSEFARPVAGEDSRSPRRLPGVWREAPVVAEGPSVADAAPVLDRPELVEIDRMIDRGEHVPAHRLLSDIYWSRPDLRPLIRERIENTASSIFFAPEPHYMEPYEVQPGDLLSRIGKRYDVPWEYLVRLNRVDPRRIRPGQKLKVIRGPFHATVDLGEFQLTVHTQDMFVKRYAVGTGKDGSTPVGRFTVRDKVANPPYTDPDGRVIAADDPANPIGERWIDLGQSYGIHGTIEPESIGKAASRGCIRMHATDVEEVYDMLQAGSVVVVRE
ncbi:MAG: L,D-transpeptidase family protein [Planctomycetales bacterium]